MAGSQQYLDRAKDASSPGSTATWLAWLSMADRKLSTRLQIKDRKTLETFITVYHYYLPSVPYTGFLRFLERWCLLLLGKFQWKLVLENPIRLQPFFPSTPAFLASVSRMESSGWQGWSRRVLKVWGQLLSKSAMVSSACGYIIGWIWNVDITWHLQTASTFQS